jgi:hypothetical protein
MKRFGETLLNVILSETTVQVVAVIALVVTGVVLVLALIQ